MTYGEKTLLVEFRSKKGAILAEHSHPHEQIGYLISGRIVLTIDGERNLPEPGDSWCIHGDVPHSGETVLSQVTVISKMTVTCVTYRRYLIKLAWYELHMRKRPKVARTQF